MKARRVHVPSCRITMVLCLLLQMAGCGLLEQRSPGRQSAASCSGRAPARAAAGGASQGGFFATHPGTDDRIKRIQGMA